VGHVAASIPAAWLAATAAFVLPILIDALIGIAAGALILLVITLGTKTWKAVRR